MPNDPDFMFGKNVPSGGVCASEVSIWHTQHEVAVDFLAHGFTRVGVAVPLEASPKCVSFGGENQVLLDDVWAFGPNCWARSGLSTLPMALRGRSPTTINSRGHL